MLRSLVGSEMCIRDSDKDALKVGGENVSAREVEDVCRTVPGIDDIAAFVNVCPDKDKAHTRIRRGFATLRDGLPVGEIPCSGTFATMPIKALTAELIALQTIRIAYYVNPGPIGYLPWTSKNRHD